MITLADTWRQTQPEQLEALNLKADWLNLIWLAGWRPASNTGKGRVAPSCSTPRCRGRFKCLGGRKATSSSSSSSSPSLHLPDMRVALPWSSACILHWGLKPWTVSTTLSFYSCSLKPTSTSCLAQGTTTSVSASKLTELKTTEERNH